MNAAPMGTMPRPRGPAKCAARPDRRAICIRTNGRIGPVNPVKARQSKPEPRIPCSTWKADMSTVKLGFGTSPGDVNRVQCRSVIGNQLGTAHGGGKLDWYRAAKCLSNGSKTMSKLPHIPPPTTPTTHHSHHTTVHQNDVEVAARSGLAKQ